MSLLSLIMRSFIIRFYVLFARNLAYWFLDTSYFVYADISDGDYYFIQVYYGVPYHMISLHVSKFSIRCQDDGRRDRNMSPLKYGKTKYIVVLVGN